MGLVNFFTDSSEEYPKKKLGDISQIQYGLTMNSKRNSLADKQLYLRVANVHRFKLDLTELKTVGVTDKDYSYLLEEGDILVVEGHADINEIGRAAIWSGVVPVYLHQNHLLKIRCLGDLKPEYVLEYINSPVGREYFRKQSKSTSGLNTINSTVLKELSIPVPSLEVQSQISSELSNIRGLALQTKNRYKALLDIHKNMLLEAIAGDERVSI